MPRVSFEVYRVTRRLTTTRPSRKATGTIRIARFGAAQR